MLSALASDISLVIAACSYLHDKLNPSSVLALCVRGPADNQIIVLSVTISGAADNEFIVYDVAQISMKYLLQVHTLTTDQG